MNALLKETPAASSPLPPANAIDFAWAYYVRYLAEAAHDTPERFDWRTQWAIAARDAFGNGFKKDGRQKQPAWQQVPGMSSAAFVSPSRVILFQLIGKAKNGHPAPAHCFPRDGWEILPIERLTGKGPSQGKPAVRSMLDDWLFDPPSEPWLVFAMGQPYVFANELVLNPANASVTGVRTAKRSTSVSLPDLRAFAALVDETNVKWTALWAAAGLPYATNELEPANDKAAKKVSLRIARRASILLRKRTLTRETLKSYFAWRARA
ncbi:MAG TPA: hypothetical protein VF292_03840 [Rhodanobacteraceae bacterium]